MVQQAAFMKIMKFGGTSVGSSDRMRALIPLINDGEKKIVVLSAMAGTTNSLVEITDLLHAGSNDEASDNINNLGLEYHQVVEGLYDTENFRRTGHELIDTHFEYIRNFTFKSFTKVQGKAILAQGELISTSLFHLLLQERNINSILLPALSFMRIDKDGEPDAYYIEENIERELNNCQAENITSTLLRLLNQGDVQGAAAQFLVWDKIRIDGQLVEDQGLLNRRKAEKTLFLTPITGVV